MNGDINLYNEHIIIQTWKCRGVTSNPRPEDKDSKFMTGQKTIIIRTTLMVIFIILIITIITVTTMAAPGTVWFNGGGGLQLVWLRTSGNAH